MVTFEDMINNLSDSELKDVFLEITEWHKTGTLTNGIVRKIYIGKDK